MQKMFFFNSLSFCFGFAFIQFHISEKKLKDIRSIEDPNCKTSLGYIKLNEM